MQNFVRFALVLLLGPGLAYAGSPPMSAYMDCARAVGQAINDKFAVIPGEASGHKGLFIYTDRDASFVPLGAPRIEDGRAYEYFLRTSISGVGDIYLNFREAKPGAKSDVQSGIGYQTTRPPTNLLDNYRAAPADYTLVERAKTVISKRLKARIATIKDFIDEKNSYATPEDAKRAFEKDRALYRTKLKNCVLEGDPDLNFAVSEEIQKLDSGFPGTTIWEIQIGGRPPAHQVRQTISANY